MHMMPLIFGNTNEKYIIKKLGGSAETKKHMADLGFNVGGEISIVNRLNGNLIINVKESRIAVNEDLAKKIMV